MARWILDCRPLCSHPWRLGIATEAHERDGAYRLRYDVFFREMGYGDPATLRSDGRDIDAYDEWCDHLILHDDERQQVIGTYRAIPGAEAMRRGGFYGAYEFDLSPLAPIAPKILQGSRTCIHPDYRTGLAFHYLSYGMEVLLREHKCQYFLGAESFRADTPNVLNRIYSYVLSQGMDPDWHVEPTPACKVEGLVRVPVTPADERLLPAIVRMEIRMGFKPCSLPAWDPDFRSYDILFLGRRDRLNALYEAFMRRVERKLPKTAV